MTNFPCLFELKKKFPAFRNFSAISLIKSKFIFNAVFIAIALVVTQLSINCFMLRRVVMTTIPGTVPLWDKIQPVSDLSIWGSCEKSPESCTRKETRVLRRSLARSLEAHFLAGQTKYSLTKTYRTSLIICVIQCEDRMTLFRTKILVNREQNNKGVAGENSQKSALA